MIPAIIQSLLLEPTPVAWLAAAKDLKHRELLLIDQANCEKKAASTALSLMYRYVDDKRLLITLSRIAREELRHFEYVVQHLKKLGIQYEQLSASRYASKLHSRIRTHEPAKQLDTLVVSALIEARSCERLGALIGIVDKDLNSLYMRLFESESRHFLVYLELAQNLGLSAWKQRIFQLAEYESKLVTTPDRTFRMHSGIPMR